MLAQRLNIAVTGGSGFIGKMLAPALLQAGHVYNSYDLHPDWLTSLLNSRLGPCPEDSLDSALARSDILLSRFQRRFRPPAVRIFGGAGPNHDICADPEVWSGLFRGCDAVVHLAAIPHPNVKGMTPADYESINYHGACNIYQAARLAKVPRFVYASSGQAYFINRFTGWRRFPIKEEDADEIHSIIRPHDYGYLKWKFERYLLENSLRDGLTSLALRLEMPGLWGADANNLFVQTSVENLQQAFLLSCSSPLDPGAHVLNIANDWVPESLVNLPAHTKLRWQGVTRDCTDNSSLLSVDKAKKLIGYRPVRNGRYYSRRAIF